tara:strand:+ start:231 stop:1202 length:972 start_codon:yes stop_codon:yes gene_type:complete
MNNILVTGGAGYIGSHVVEKLEKTNSNIVIIDNLKTGFKKLINSKVEFVKGDINNIKLVKKIINKKKINTIIHLAGLIDSVESEKKKKKYFKNNVTGTLNLIKACKNSEVINFIFSSSAGVYGNISRAAIETMSLKPNNYYAYTKLKCEKIIKKYSKIYKYKYSILRLFNACGASPSGKLGIISKKNKSFFKILAKESLKKKPIINIYGNNHITKDGTCVRDFIHVSDLALLHIKCLDYLIKNRKSLLINCGYGIGYSVHTIAKIFREKINKSTKIKFMKKRKGEISVSYASINKMKKFLKWKPKYNRIEYILKSSIKWEKKI